MTSQNARFGQDKKLIMRGLPIHNLPFSQNVSKNIPLQLHGVLRLLSFAQNPNYRGWDDLILSEIFGILCFPAHHEWPYTWPDTTRNWN